MGRIAILERSEYEYENENEKKHETMWCTEVAGGALLVFRIVVSGDIGDHCRYAAEDGVPGDQSS